MSLINRTEFERLAQVHQPQCVSIYIPTHREAGGGENLEKDRLALKNAIKEAKKQLKIFQRTEEEADEYLKPITALLDDQNYWQNQSDGLALFYDGTELKEYQLPTSFHQRTYVNSHFYLKPLAAHVTEHTDYMILALSINEVKLYQANQTELFEIAIADLAPQKMTDTVGEDYEPKHLQQRSGHGEANNSDGMYHGHGTSNETVKKEEALRFFHALNNGLERLLNEKGLPLVVASVDYLFAIYKEANSYKHLVDENINGNVEDMKLNELHNKAHEIISPLFETKKLKAVKQFEAYLSEGNASYDLEDVIPAAIGGRTETLFLSNSDDVWGKYLQNEHKIEVNTVRDTRDSELLNMAAIETIKNGGTVYVLEEEQLPEASSPANAIFRYNYSENS